MPNTVVDSIRTHGLEKYLNCIGYVSHEEAIAYQKRSQLLVLIEINSEDTKAIIPGKLFEYMISETPLIAIGPEESDVEKIIISTNTGAYFNYSEKQKLGCNFYSIAKNTYNIPPVFILTIYDFPF